MIYSLPLHTAGTIMTAVASVAIPNRNKKMEGSGDKFTENGKGNDSFEERKETPIPRNHSSASHPTHTAAAAPAPGAAGGTAAGPHQFQDADERFGCNICLDPVQDPVVTLCGHLYW
jgi:hypothetical protein